MLKTKLIFLVKDKIGTQTGDRTIALELENAINQVLGQLFARDLSQWNAYAKPFIADIVRTDVRPFALHPVRVIQTPEVNNGIVAIYSEKEDDRKYESMPMNGLMTYEKLGLGNLTDTVGFVVYAEKVEFWNLPPSVEKVREFIVRPFSEWDDNEDFPLPAGAAETVIQMAIDSIKGNQIENNIYKSKKAQPQQ